MFKIIWSKNASDDLKKLPRNISKRIYKKVWELSNNPFRSSKKVGGEPFYKFRVGNYRIFFTIMKNKISILILKVEHRKKVYKK